MTNINNQRLIDTFVEIAEIDSPTGSEIEMVNWAIAKLKSLGAAGVSKDNFGNVVARFNGRGTPVILTAHLDTVEPGRGIRTLVNDKYIQSHGETIVGADDKTAIAAIVEALICRQEKNIETKPLEVIFTLSEEIGNYGAASLDYSTIQGKIGLAFDLDGQANQIITASPFYERFDIEIIGKAAHASQPENALNVIPPTADFFASLKLGRLSPNTLRNIGVISGGDARNTILGHISLVGEIRSYNEEELVSAITQTENAANLLVEKYPGLVVEFSHERENPGFDFSETAPGIVAAAEAVAQTGLSPEYRRVLGCFDANIFAAHGIQIATLGGGYEFSHTVNERVIIAQLEKMAQVALTYITAT